MLKNHQDGEKKIVKMVNFMLCAFSSLTNFNEKQKWHLMCLIWKPSCVRV